MQNFVAAAHPLYVPVVVYAVCGIAAGLLLSRFYRCLDTDIAQAGCTGSPNAAPIGRLDNARLVSFTIVALTSILWCLLWFRTADPATTTMMQIVSTIPSLVFISAFILIAAIDWQHMLVPTRLCRNVIIIGWFFAVAIPRGNWIDSLVDSFGGALLGAAIGLLLYWLGSFMFVRQIKQAQTAMLKGNWFRQEDQKRIQMLCSCLLPKPIRFGYSNAIDSAIGLGDVYLFALAGTYLGWQAVLPLLAIAAVLGALAGSMAKLRSGNPGAATGCGSLVKRWQSGVSVYPFGPFIAAAAFICLFTGWRFP